MVLDWDNDERARVVRPEARVDQGEGFGRPGDDVALLAEPGPTPGRQDAARALIAGRHVGGGKARYGVTFCWRRSHQVDCAPFRGGRLATIAMRSS